MLSNGAGVFTKLVACFGALTACVGLCGSAAAQPSLTECGGAREIVDGTPIEFYDCDLVVDGPPQGACDAQAVLSDFWLSYTFTVDGTATLYLSGFEYIEVYAGSCGALGDALVCSAGSSVSFDGPVGATRLVRAGYFSGDCGGTLGVIVSSPGRALPTSFTYQGRLSDGGSPTNGTVDMQFRLFDFYSGGVQVGPVLYRPGVTVNDGYLTTPLDFGAGVCDGRDLWLEIMVNGETLSPRQELTATSYALYAVNAGTAAYAASAGTAGYASSAGSAATATRADNGGHGGVLVENLLVGSPTFTQHGFVFPNGAFVPIVQSQRTLTLPAGRATLDWSMAGFASQNSMTIQLRVVVAGQASAQSGWFFERVLDTKNMSGHVVFDIPAEITGVVGLEVKTNSGQAFTIGSGTPLSWNLVVYKD